MTTPYVWRCCYCGLRGEPTEGEVLLTAQVLRAQWQRGLGRARAVVSGIGAYEIEGTG